VVDDHSTTDDPEAVVQAVGGSRVDFYQQPGHVGPPENFNTCIRRARGHLVHILHGDDYVQAGFYGQVARVFEDWPKAAAVFARCFTVDERGELEGISDRLAPAEAQPTCDASWIYYGSSILTPGVVVRRIFYEEHGGFVPELVHTADWEMCVRIITRGSAIAVNEPLASYRLSDDSHTSQMLRTGECWRDYLRFGDVCVHAGVVGFDPGYFRDTVARRAIKASRRFSRVGDSDAARANRDIFKELARPSLKIDEGVRNLRGLFPG
jgi:hypothetical protein